MESHRGVLAWYLAFWLVLALAPAAYALFGSALDIGGAWRWLCDTALSPAAAPSQAGDAVRRPKRASSGFVTPVLAREDDWLTQPLRPFQRQE